MPKPSLISGAKGFLEHVFAHRTRKTELYVASFRLKARSSGLPTLQAQITTSQLPGRATQEGARFLSDWKLRADWTEI